MVKIVNVHMDQDTLEELGAVGEVYWGPENREEPQEKTTWVVCPGCGWRIPKSLRCSDCGEDLSPRPCPVPLNKGKRLV